MRIGIVGLGFVGEATVAGFTNRHRLLEVETFDIDKSKNSTCSSLKELVGKTTLIFVCVPTPMQADGSCDTRIVEQVVADISAILWNQKYPYVFEVVIKSTVPPNTTDRLNRENENILITFNPEFLTEANHIYDFLNQDRIIIGIPPERNVYPSTHLRVSNAYNLAFPNVPQSCMWANEAEMLKYATNAFLAMKVIFANELDTLCTAMGVCYEDMVSGLKLDDRLGVYTLASSRSG
jgi:UDPglucose 6-dehydrogenase